MIMTPERLRELADAYDAAGTARNDAIRQARAEGMQVQAIATAVGVGPEQVRRIVKRAG